MSYQFDRQATEYGATVERAIRFARLPHSFYLRAKAERLLGLARRHVGDPRSLTALDVGCGGGLFDLHVVAELGALHGVDVSPEMVAHARREVPSAEYRAFGGGRLPYEDESFDLTFAVNVLHHVPRVERQPLIAEMRRVTRPGGLVAIFEHNPLNPLTQRVVRRIDFDDPAELLRRGAVVQLLRRARLRVVEQAFMLFFPSPRARIQMLERYLGRVPLGAQHLVAGVRDD